MCTRGQCHKYIGSWVHFRTQWGVHRGIVADVNDRAVLMRVPRQYVPAGLVNATVKSQQPDEERLDLALAQWGYGYGYPGYGRWGYPGYGGWYGGWWWWWLAFAWIFALALLW